MADKWVDNDDYFGPDRRDGGGLRLRNRRRFDETSEPPSLAATLRRLLVLLANPLRPDSYERALQLIAAAGSMAERMGNSACIAALKLADQSLRDAPDDFDRVETIVGEAMASI